MTAVSRATLAAAITSLLADNTSGDITAEDLRSVLNDAIDSANFPEDGTDASEIPAKTTPVAADSVMGLNSENSSAAARYTFTAITNYIAAATATLTAKTLTNPKVSFSIYDAGTKSSGTFTPAYTDGNMQKCVNGGAFTLAPQSGDGQIVLKVTNNGSAGAVTTSGWTKVTGDSLTTTNTHKFYLTLTVADGDSWLNVVALQ